MNDMEIGILFRNLCELIKMHGKGFDPIVDGEELKIVITALCENSFFVCIYIL